MSAETHDMVVPFSRLRKWDRRFLHLAGHVATWSKDPRRQVGAVLVHRFDARLLTVGYNGFPPGIEDTDERLHSKPVKNQLMQHAVRNALDNAAFDTTGAHLCAIRHLCVPCALSAISMGIQRVVQPLPDESENEEEGQRWAHSLLEEAGVRVIYFSPDRGS